MRGAFLSVDCGTSYVKAALLDERGRTKRLSRRKCACKRYPDGRIEQSAEGIISSVVRCIKDLTGRSGSKRTRVCAISVANQRATVIRLNGRVPRDAVSWQDTRGASYLERLRKELPEKKYYSITGLPYSPIFTLSKILDLKGTGSAGNDRFVLVHDYVMKRLGCGDFFTDHSNASLTGLMDVSRLVWDERILKLSGISASELPVLVSPGTKIGVLSDAMASRCGLTAGVPLVAGGGDQQCAALGAGCIKEGACKVTMGTAGVALAATASPVRDDKRRILCCAHAAPGMWEVEGLQNSAGASVSWFKEITGENDRAMEDLSRATEKVPEGARGVFFYPFLAGAAAPHWNMSARGVMTGLSCIHGKAEILKAVMESVSMESRRILDVFGDLGIGIDKIILTGGGSYTDAWNRMQADIYGKKVYLTDTPEATLKGAAMLAAYGCGAYTSLAKAVNAMTVRGKVYTPSPRRMKAYRELYRKYDMLYARLRDAGVFDAS